MVSSDKPQAAPLGATQVQQQATRGADRAPSSRGRDRQLRIALIDPRRLNGSALARALERSARDLRVLLLADPREIGGLPPSDMPDLVLLSIDGISVQAPGTAEAVEAVRAVTPELPIVVLASAGEPSDIVAAVTSGIRGYILMTLELHLAVEALRFVAAGGTFVPAEPILARFAEERNSPADVAEPASPSNAPAATTGGFSARQIAVLSLLRLGRSNRAIASELAIAENAVKADVRQIMKKLGASNRTQVALLAEQVAGPLPGPGT
jgi:DNA-binding NarL/FixJ family response regulator